MRDHKCIKLMLQMELYGVYKCNTYLYRQSIHLLYYISTLFYRRYYHVNLYLVNKSYLYDNIEVILYFNHLFNTDEHVSRVWPTISISLVSIYYIYT